MNRASPILPLALALLCWPTAVAAAPNVDGAARAFVEAKQHFENRDYVRAIAAFTRAYQLEPHYQVQCSIARCHEKLNQAVEAAEHYQRCLDEGAAGSTIAPRIRNSLNAARARISVVEVAGTPGAVLYLDGLPVGRIPRRQTLNPGRHVLEARREGWLSVRAIVEVLGGERPRLTLVLTRLSAASTASGETPSSQALVASAEAEPTTKSQRRRLSPVWFWSAAGLSVALAGAAIACGASSLSARSDYESNPTKEGLDRFLERRTITNVLLGLAGAAAAGGTVLFFFTDFHGARESRGLNAGLTLRGSF